MKAFLQTALTKIKDYFTANTGCKIFFLGLITTILCLLLYVFTHVQVFYVLVLLVLFVSLGGTLWDSMVTRYYFLQQIHALQYAHLQEAYAKQAAGEVLEITPTFTAEEKSYLRRRKWGFVLAIILKVGLVIALFSLLLHL
ncbi:MAG: hypothetical protein NC133_02755 [Prevotella sp.]|nr:hypothetical protein [Prevotella sp.]